MRDTLTTTKKTIKALGGNLAQRVKGQARAEVSAAPNPWTLTQTYHVVDDPEAVDGGLAEDLRTFGVLKVKNVLGRQEVAGFLDAARAISGMTDDDVLRVASQETPSFAEPGSVIRHSDLWPLMVHERLLAPVRAILGPDARFFGRDSLGVHFSSVKFHKDTKVSDQILGPNGYPADFSTLRVIFYLSDPGRPATRFGFKPFSHLDAPPKPPLGASLGEEQADERAVWISFDPGDCVMFDARLTHSGDELGAPKYMVVLTYDLETEHAIAVFHETCTSRAEKGYGYDQFSPEVIEVLRHHDLLISGLDDPSTFARSRTG